MKRNGRLISVAVIAIVAALTLSGCIRLGDFLPGRGNGSSPEPGGDSTPSADPIAGTITDLSFEVGGRSMAQSHMVSPVRRREPRLALSPAPSATDITGSSQRAASITQQSACTSQSSARRAVTTCRFRMMRSIGSPLSPSKHRLKVLSSTGWLSQCSWLS